MKLPRSRLGSLIFLALFMLVTSLTVASATSHEGNRMTIVDIEFIGIATYDVNFEFAGTPVGGLSGITYDAGRGVYYVVSDDRSQRAPARYYEVDIRLNNDEELEDGGVFFKDVVFITDQNANLFPERFVDPEGIALLAPGQIFISSEGDPDAGPVIDPFVNRFNPAGKQDRPLVIPDKFLPNGQETWGIRDNLAFEGLTVPPGRNYVATATENALHQDGTMSTLSDSSPSRVLIYDASSKMPMAEYVYVVHPIPKDSDPPGIFADNGLSEVLALDDAGTFLIMERSFAVTVGNTVRLFEATTDGATDVSAYPSLLGLEQPGDTPDPVDYDPMPRTFVADFEVDLGVVPDNLEAMTFGPPLSDGRQLLIAVSDNNFRAAQTTQFIALAVTMVPAD